MTSGSPGRLSEAVELVKKKAGKALLSDKDLFVLMGDELARTISYEELQYGIKDPCKKS